MKAVPHLHYQVLLEEAMGKELSNATRKHEKEAIQEKYADLRVAAYELYTQQFKPSMLNPDDPDCLLGGWEAKEVLTHDFEGMIGPQDVAIIFNRKEGEGRYYSYYEIRIETLSNGHSFKIGGMAGYEEPEYEEHTYSFDGLLDLPTIADFCSDCKRAGIPLEWSFRAISLLKGIKPTEGNARELIKEDNING